MKQPQKAANIDVMKKGLPSSIEHERYVLGSVLINDALYASITGAITTEVFTTQAHRTIWTRISEMAERGEKIDRSTIYNELNRFGEAESVGGLGYIVSLDDGIPALANIDAYVRILVEKSRLRKAAYAAQKTLNQALSGEYTADEVSLNGQAMLAEQTGGYGSSQIESVQEFVESYPGGVNVFLNPSLNNKGIPTGFVDIDAVTGGFHATEIFIFGARPSHGKSSLASVIAKNVARQGKTVAFFTMEMDKTMMLHRMITENAYVEYTKFRDGKLDEEERRRVRQSTSEIMDLDIQIDETTGPTVAEIRVKLNRILRNKPVHLLVLDYAQLIKAPKGAKFMNDNEKFYLIGEGLKQLCKDTKIPLLLLSQLNRDSEKATGDARPKLSQSRGSGVWDEIAYVGACIYREWLKKKDRKDLEGIAELLIEKNRSGPARNIQLAFNGPIMRFGNAEF